MPKPDAADEVLGEADEQGILVAGRGAGLAVDESVRRVCAPRRAALHRPTQGLKHGRRGRRRHDSRPVFPHRQSNDVAARPNRSTQEADLRQHAVVLKRRVGLRQFHRRGLHAADRHERGRIRRRDVEPPDDLDHALTEPHRHFGPRPIAGLRQRKVERDRGPLTAQPIWFRRPGRSPEWPGREALVQAQAGFMHADQRKKLPGRTDRARNVRGAVPLARVGAGAGERQRLS